MNPLRSARAALMLVIVFLWDLVDASFGVARIVLSRRVETSPAIVVVPLELEREWAVALAAYFASLTPGSTCLHVSDDRKRLYIHVLDTHDADATIARFKQHFERWIKELGG